MDPNNVTLVPPRDSRALTAAIADHLANPARYVALARREQERVYAKHSLAAVASRLRAILERRPWEPGLR